MFCDVVYWELSEAVRMPRFLGYEYGYGGRGTRDEGRDSRSIYWRLEHKCLQQLSILMKVIIQTEVRVYQILATRSDVIKRRDGGVHVNETYAIEMGDA
jgi:hypothetical protein